MATIGQQLTAPEAGWQRIDNNNEFLKYTGNWVPENASAHYNGTQHYAVNNDSGEAKISFRFKGTKLRLGSYNSPAYRIQDVRVVIDGVEEVASAAVGSEGSQVMYYEKVGLSDSIHAVDVRNGEATFVTKKSYGLDWIDIDSAGYILPLRPVSVGMLRTNVKDMQIGDYITCKYKATSGAAGFFSDLGGQEGPGISVTGAATPDGTFYFIKVDKGTLIADRIVQTNISWNGLNTAGYLEGKIISDVPVMTSNNAPSGVAKASTVYSSGYQAYMAFNGVEGETGWAAATAPEYWLSYTFSSAKVIRHYSLTSRVDYGGVGLDGDWVFEGTNDEIYWVALDTKSRAFASTVASKKIMFSYQNDTAYKTYRLRFIAMQPNNTPAVAEMKLMENLFTVRSLSGGVSSIDNFGNPTRNYYPNGGWPADNEFDRYISNFPTEKIKAGMTIDDVFHSSSMWTYCKDTAMSGAWQRKDGVVSASLGSDSMIARSTSLTWNPEWGTIAPVVSSAGGAAGGFRPTLEYEE